MTCPSFAIDCPREGRTVQKSPCGGKYCILCGVVLRKRRHSGFWFVLYPVQSGSLVLACFYGTGPVSSWTSGCDSSIRWLAHQLTTYPLPSRQPSQRWFVSSTLTGDGVTEAFRLKLNSFAVAPFLSQKGAATHRSAWLLCKNHIQFDKLEGIALLLLYLNQNTFCCKCYCDKGSYGGVII